MILTHQNTKAGSSDTSQSAPGARKILMFFLQMQTVLLRTSDIFFSFSSPTVNTASAAFTLKPEGVECAAPVRMQWYFQFMISMIIPLVILSLSAVVFVVMKFALKKSADANIMGVGLFFAMFDIWYFGGATSILGIFSCTLYNSASSSGQLAIAPFVSCNNTDPLYQSVVAGASVCFAIYILGYPLAIFLLLHRKRDSLDDPQVRLLYGRHYLTFRTEFFYWKLVIIGRRLAIAAIVTIVPFYRRSLLLAFVFMIFALCDLLQKLCAPYARPVDNVAEEVSLTILMSSFFLGTLVLADPFSTQSQDGVRGFVSAIVIACILYLSYCSIPTEKIVVLWYTKILPLFRKDTKRFSQFASPRASSSLQAPTLESGIEMQQSPKPSNTEPTSVSQFSVQASVC
jgi:hypothetical protein